MMQNLVRRNLATLPMTTSGEIGTPSNRRHLVMINGSRSGERYLLSSATVHRATKSALSHLSGSSGIAELVKS